MHDLVIRGGVVVDGTGAERRRANSAGAGETHDDGQSTWDPDLAPLSVNGVISIPVGNCRPGCLQRGRR